MGRSHTDASGILTVWGGIEDEGHCEKHLGIMPAIVILPDSAGRRAVPMPIRFVLCRRTGKRGDRPEGYHIELLAGGDSMEYLVPQSAPEYYDTAQFVQKA